MKNNCGKWHRMDDTKQIIFVYLLLCIIRNCLGYIEIGTSQKEGQLGNQKKYPCPT